MSWMEVFMGITALLSFLTLVYTFNVNKSRASRKELEMLQTEDDQLRTVMMVHAERLATLEARVANMPNTAAMASITDSMNDLNGTVQKMAGGFESLNEQVARITDFLMKGPK